MKPLVYSLFRFRVSRIPMPFPASGLGGLSRAFEGRGKILRGEDGSPVGLGNMEEWKAGFSRRARVFVGYGIAPPPPPGDHRSADAFVTDSVHQDVDNDLNRGQSDGSRSLVRRASGSRVSGPSVFSSRSEVFSVSGDPSCGFPMPGASGFPFFLSKRRVRSRRVAEPFRFR